MKHKQTMYAIVRKSAWRYRNDLRCPLLSGQLPIFWLRQVAVKYLQEYNIEEEYEVVKVCLREE